MSGREYQRTVVAYHGCDMAVAHRVLAGKARLHPSTNTYDWLGEKIEGKPAFPGSKIALKSHIQVAVRDPACIIGVFRPDPAVCQREG